MVFELVDVDFSHMGSRFLLFPQPPVVAGFEVPEVVYVSGSPGTLGPGPSDDRMYVANARGKPGPYDFPYLPPYRGPEFEPARAGPDGHFDHVLPGSPQFLATHMYGTLRMVLDIWEAYFRRPIPWHFGADYPRMELVPWLDWDNAQSGWGFIEAGYRLGEGGARTPMALNFDVLAHELGHSILYAEVGMPPPGLGGAEYFAFHESASDLVAIVASLHFDSVLDALLRDTAGNLFARNFLSRIGESSKTHQIRLASNDYRMSDVPHVDTPVEQLSQRERHHMGEPLTGAVFDVLVEVFQQRLVEAGLIDDALDRASRRESREPAHLRRVQQRFDRLFARDPEGFKQALVDARDYMGITLANAWQRLDWRVRFVDVGRALLRADLEVSGGHFQPEILDALTWREFGA